MKKCLILLGLFLTSIASFAQSPWATPTTLFDIHSWNVTTCTDLKVIVYVSDPTGSMCTITGVSNPITIIGGSLLYYDYADIAGGPGWNVDPGSVGPHIVVGIEVLNCIGTPGTTGGVCSVNTIEVGDPTCFPSQNGCFVYSGSCGLCGIGRTINVDYIPGGGAANPSHFPNIHIGD